MSEQAEELINDHDNNTPTSWLSTLPLELQKEKSLEKFDGVPPLVKSYLELEKSLNAHVAVPKNEASEEDWHKFYNRLGRPEDKRYTDNRAAEEEQYLTKCEEIFYNIGLSKRQGEKMLEELYNFSDSLQKKQEEEIQSSCKSNEDELKSYYSDKGGLDSKIDLINLALNKYAQPELADCIKETHYNPALINHTGHEEAVAPPR